MVSPTEIGAIKLFILFGLIQLSASHHGQRIIFPLKYIEHSIDLQSGVKREILLPTGKCEDFRERDIVLNLPGIAPRTLYPGFIDSWRISCLSLTDSFIERIPSGSFADLPNLLYLDLSRNRIEFCDILNFGNNERLKTLIIDENNSQGQHTDLILSSSSYFSQLKNLYLRKNYLRYIKLSIRRYFPSLTHLYLSDNRLEGHTFNYIDLPFTLTHLHIERNWIRRIDTGELINLSSLFLDGNRIVSICSWQCRETEQLVLRGMSRLEFLSLSKNEIALVERDSFEETRHLKSLNLAHNSLTTIPFGTLNVLHELRDLSLSYNQLIIIPDFSRLEMLTSLSLDHNHLDHVPSGSFTNLYQMKWLSLGGNRIRNVEANAFVNLPMLEELDLSDNKLSYLPRGWIIGTCLQHLDVRGNNFNNFQSLSLNNLESLSHLYIQGTPLNQIATSTYWQLNSNVTVHLEHSASVRRGACYVMCDNNYVGYTIPRITFSDGWTG